MALAFGTVVTLMTSFTVAVMAQAERSRHDETPLGAMSQLIWLDTQWVLAFRLKGGVQQSAYDSYTTRDVNDDQPLSRLFLPSSCFQPPFRCCPHHYHSALLNIWPSKYIDQVRLSIVEGGEERAYVLFNGTGSTVMSWFAPDRILSSSWTDLTTQPHNYFSIDGHHRSSETPARYQHSRRFYIFRNYGGCPVDSGWLSVQDQPRDVCPWGTLSAAHPFPAIMYSKRNTFVNFNTKDVGVADSLLVMVKFLPFDDNLNMPCPP